MSSNKNCCNCGSSAGGHGAQQRSGGNQQQQGGVCKKELALMKMLAEQMKPPPLQVCFKVGVPKRPENCESDEEPPPKSSRFNPNPRRESEASKKAGAEFKCPLMADNLKAIQERKNNSK